MIWPLALATVAVLCAGAPTQLKRHHTMLYNGGPVLSNVKIYVIFWSDKVRHQSDWDAFYKTIVQSDYLDWLSEYNTPTQTIGRGSYMGSFVDTDNPYANETDVSELALVSRVTDLIAAGRLPAQHDPDALYTFHLPPRLNVSFEAAAGTVYTCYAPTPAWPVRSHAAHGPIRVQFSDGTSPWVPFAMVPDCDKPFDTAAASHELIEAITNPTLPRAWAVAQTFEIADACEEFVFGPSVVGPYDVARGWSNKYQNCLPFSPLFFLGQPNGSSHTV